VIVNVNVYMCMNLFLFCKCQIFKKQNFV
jgi:hypothetical protein